MQDIRGMVDELFLDDLEPEDDPEPESDSAVDPEPEVAHEDPVQSIQAQFLSFHAKNPQVYAKLVSLCREAKVKGKKKIGIKMLWEVMRWMLWLGTTDEEFKLNNNYTSRYARLLMRQEKDLADIFEIRQLKA